MRITIAILIAVTVTAYALPAYAFEAKSPLTDSITINENLKMLWDETNPDSDFHFFAAINRFNIQAQKGDFLYGLRYDVEAYFEKEEYAVKYVPEKVFFQVDKRYWDLRLGDYYNTLGRGLALSVLKNDQFGEDTTIQGGLGNLKTEYFKMRALGGWVNEADSLDFDPERAKHGETEYEKRDLLYGGSITTGHPTYFLVGGNYVGGKLPTPDDAEFPQFEEDDEIDIFSGSVEVPDFVYGSFYSEYAYLLYEDDRIVVDNVEYEGRGAYAGLTLFYGPVTYIGEYKDYYRMDFAHNEPPNLEYEKTTFSHAPRTDDVIGFKNRLDFMIPVIDTLVYGVYYNCHSHEMMVDELADHYSQRIEDKVTGEVNRRIEWVEHSYGGIEKTFSNSAFIFGSGGYRENLEGRWIHGELDTGYPVASSHQLSAAVHMKQFASMDALDAVYGSEWYSLEYAFSPWIIVTAIYENSDEPLSEGLDSTNTDDDPNFYSGQVTVEPHEQVRVSMFYGKEKGGLQCAGGVCRTVPPFKGFKMDLQVRF